MSNVTTLDARGIREKIGLGWTLERFLEVYNCSEPELRKQFNRIWHNKETRTANRLWNALLANSKKKNNLQKKKGQKAKKNKALEAFDEALSEICEPIEYSKEKELNQLEKLKHSQLAQVKELEDRLKVLREDHRSYFEKEKRLKEEIDCLMAKLEIKKAGHKKALDQQRSIETNISATSVLLMQKNTDLEKTLREIEMLKKLNVGVYNNGQIEPLDGEETLNDSGWEKVYDKLIHTEEMLDLSARKIKALARLKAIIENTLSKVELVFDDEELEKAFSLIA